MLSVSESCIDCSWRMTYEMMPTMFCTGRKQHGVWESRNCSDWRSIAGLGAVRPTDRQVYNDWWRPTSRSQSRFDSFVSWYTTNRPTRQDVWRRRCYRVGLRQRIRYVQGRIRRRRCSTRRLPVNCRPSTSPGQWVIVYNTSRVI